MLGALQPARAARAGGLACLLLAVVAPLGCQKGKAVVKGKVTFGNRPVPVGTVGFVAADGRSASGALQKDGSYTINDAPVGEVKITVTTPPRPMMGAGMPKPPPGMKMPAEMQPAGGGAMASGAQDFVPVPEKYNKADTTPLTYTVTRGEQVKDLNLSP